jgi:hypothetical protein
MAGSTPEFSGWNKLLMGFIHQDELRCVAKKTKRTVFLSATNLVDGPKLGVINVAPGVSNCFEARKDFDGKTGLLVYQVNTNFDHGNGPFWGEEELLKQGGSLDFEGSKFKVLATSSAGVLVQVNA